METLWGGRWGGKMSEKSQASSRCAVEGITKRLLKIMKDVVCCFYSFMLYVQAAEKVAFVV